MTRVVQLTNGAVRRVALVDEPYLRLLVANADENRAKRDIESVYALAAEAIRTSTPLSELARCHATGEALDYDAIYSGASPWRLVSPIDHPDESSRCIVSGTGLTHIGSARDRHKMH